MSKPQGNSFTIISSEGIAIDTLPFGSIEINDEFNAAHAAVQITTNGFKKFYEGALESFSIDDEQ